MHSKLVDIEIIWVVKSMATINSGHNTTLCHNTDCGHVGLGQYGSLGEYCGPHTASSVFFILKVWNIEMDFSLGRIL